jgi:transposase
MSGRRLAHMAPWDANSPPNKVGILAYGYATGICSSSRLEQASYVSMAFRFIAVLRPPLSSN